MAINSTEVHSVNNWDPETKCPDGKSFDDCDAARALQKNTEGYKPEDFLTALDELPHFNRLLYMPLGCVACQQICVISIELLNRQPTGKAVMLYESPDFS